jgi:hypothetical protein
VAQIKLAGKLAILQQLLLVHIIIENINNMKIKEENI